MAFAWLGREKELCSQVNFAGNMTSLDPTGWQGLGNVSLYSFPPFLRKFLCLHLTWPSTCCEWWFCGCCFPGAVSLSLRRTSVLEAALASWFPHDTRRLPANDSHQARLFHLHVLKHPSESPNSPNCGWRTPKMKEEDTLPNAQGDSSQTLRSAFTLRADTQCPFLSRNGSQTVG